MTLREHAQASLIKHLVRHRTGCWWFQRPFPVPREEPIHLFVVLLGFERAGAVHQEAAGRYPF